MILDKKSFANLCIPVYGDKLFMKKYDKLIKKIFPGLWTVRRIDLDKIISYVVYMYDLQSPMRKFFSDIGERKKECAVLAGYDLEADKKRVEKIFDFTDSNITDLVTAFLKYQNNKAWAVLQSNEEVLWQYHQELLNPITVFKQDKEKLQALEIKSKLMHECDAIIKRIEVYQDKIFGGDQRLISQMNSSPTSPESIAYVQNS